MDILSYKMIKDNKQVRENLFNHDWVSYRFIRSSGNILLQDKVLTPMPNQFNHCSDTLTARSINILKVFAIFIILRVCF